jgi:hypothetical protein
MKTYANTQDLPIGRIPNGVTTNGFLLPLRSMREMSQKKFALAPIFFQQNPDITDGKGANYAGDSPMGSTEPFANFSYSNARSINLTLAYTAISRYYDHKWVFQQVSRLMALVYPIYRRRTISNADFSPPPMVLLNYGQRFFNLPCKVLDYSTSTDREKVIDVMTNLPLEIEITINLQVSYPFGYAPGHDDIADRFGDNDPNGDKGESILPGITSPLGAVPPNQLERYAPRPLLREANDAVPNQTMIASSGVAGLNNLSVFSSSPITVQALTRTLGNTSFSAP